MGRNNCVLIKNNTKLLEGIKMNFAKSIFIIYGTEKNLIIQELCRE